ncbi:hypothetical protein NPIL_182701 [Nephila pilipes]|uniref:Uncharacterized protein n=1 Tax=Nephila pilipes TaxID=299642 RepID=A0A8X6NCK0_NEPPI|nr:hypothetical protein NPIL_182701 [Nephila pilipes]
MGNRRKGCGRNVTKIAAYLGPCVYNDGQSSLVSVAKKLDLLIDKKMKMHFQILDKLRVRNVEKRVSEQSQVARKTKRQRVLKDNENMRMKKGDVYVPGEVSDSELTTSFNELEPDMTTPRQWFMLNVDTPIIRSFPLNKSENKISKSRWHKEYFGFSVEKKLYVLQITLPRRIFYLGRLNSAPTLIRLSGRHFLDPITGIATKQKSIR